MYHVLQVSQLISQKVTEEQKDIPSLICFQQKCVETAEIGSWGFYVRWRAEILIYICISLTLFHTLQDNIVQCQTTWQLKHFVQILVTVDVSLVENAIWITIMTPTSVALLAKAQSVHRKEWSYSSNDLHQLQLITDNIISECFSSVSETFKV